MSRGILTAGSTMEAHRVDMLDACGHLDVSEFVPSFFVETIDDPNRMFTDNMNRLPIQARVRGSRAEYVMLVRRQVRSKKVVLGRCPKHVAERFTVGKKGSDKLREIWNGSQLSQAAIEPPGMPWLATPTSLTSLEATGDDKIWMSCRDGRVFFDQMGLPAPIRPFFGKAGVTVKELRSQVYKGDCHPRQHALTDDEIREAMQSDDLGPLTAGDASCVLANGLCMELECVPVYND